MNSKSITNFIDKNKILILIFWIAIGSFVTIAFAPQLLSSTKSEFTAPAGTDSANAKLLLEQYFPKVVQNGEHIILFNNPSGSVLTEEFFTVNQKLVSFILEKFPDADIQGYAMVVGTELDSFKESFLSSDGKVSIVTISVIGEQHDQIEYVQELRENISSYSTSLDIYVLGQFALEADTDHSIEKDMSQIDAIVVPIVFLALIILLRNWKYLPITIIPIFLSIGTSFGLLERYINLTHGIIQGFVPSVLISLTLGVGVDYNLFLLTRFREERKLGKTVREAVDTMMERAGHTVITSGVTLILAMSGLVFFPVSMLSSVGVGISISITVLLLMNLTFTPALLLLFGNWVEKAGDMEVQKVGSKFWYSIGKFSTKNSLIVISVILLLSVPIIVNMANFSPDSQTIFFSPKGSESREGMQILQDSFGQGIIGPLSIVVVPGGGSVMTPEVFNQSHKMISRLIGELGINPFNILSQTWLNGSAIDFNFAVTAFNSSSPLYNVTQVALYRIFASPYISENVDVMRISLRIEEDVWSPEAMAKVDSINKIVREEFSTDVTGIYGVTTNSNAVIDSTMELFPLMILGIIIVIYLFIGIMFGAAVLPLRLIATIGLTLSFIFGATTVVFEYSTILNDYIPILNDMEVTFWMVPVMSFSIIIGLGIDYDVFTLERIRENLSHGMSNEEAISAGISKTSTIITSAGIIMMIAFGGLMFSSSYILVQFGFVLTVSVFLDTFLVRSVLVPSIMSIGEKWNWWPGNPVGEPVSSD